VIVPAEGGPERVVGRIAVLWGFRGMDWWPDGKSLLVRDAPTRSAAIVRLFLNDGRKVPFSFPSYTQADGMPTVSPDGSRVAFLRYYASSTEVCWSPIAGGETHCVARPKSVRGIAWHHRSNALYYADDTALWRIGLGGGLWDTAVKIADGNFSGLAADHIGKHLAFNRTVSDSNLWRLARDGKPPTRLIASSGEDSDPSWSPDGRHIVIRSNRSGAYELYVYNADGTGERQVTHFGAHMSSVRWSPDGQWLAFDGNRAPVDPAVHYHNIYVVPSVGGPWRRITEDKYNYTGPNWSPDGKWIYYTQLSQPFESRKAPLAGGPSSYVGKAMYDITESGDGKYFYFTYEESTGGIWRRPVAGGEDVLMKGTEGVHLYRYWDLTRDGLFFVNPAPRPTLRVLDLRSGRVEKIAELPPALLLGPRGLAASPDGRSIVYTLQDVMLGDIMLIADL
jgi:Tol biopolymer transport system component